MACHYPTGDTLVVLGGEYLYGRRGDCYLTLEEVNALTGVCTVRSWGGSRRYVSIGTLKGLRFRPGGYHEVPASDV